VCSLIHTSTILLFGFLGYCFANYSIVVRIEKQYHFLNMQLRQSHLLIEKKPACFILHNWREIFQYVSKYKNNPSETRDSGARTEDKSKVISFDCCSLSHTNKRTGIRRSCTMSITRYVLVTNMTTTRCLMAIVFYMPITKPLAKQMWCITDEKRIIFTLKSHQTSQHGRNNTKTCNWTK
jgi:hypothetical protein